MRRERSWLIRSIGSAKNRSTDLANVKRTVTSLKRLGNSGDALVPSGPTLLGWLRIWSSNMGLRGRFGTTEAGLGLPCPRPLVSNPTGLFWRNRFRVFVPFRFGACPQER